MVKSGKKLKSLKTLYIAFSLIVGFGLPSAYIYGNSQQAEKIDRYCDIVFSTGTKLSLIPLAETKAQQRKGLSRLDDVGAGMLFRWESADIRHFWMKDTNEDLSIGFFSDEGELFSIKDMVARSLDIHSSAKPARYALELKAGSYPSKGIALGTKITSIKCN